jgi:hypothetical protein
MTVQMRPTLRQHTLKVAQMANNAATTHLRNTPRKSELHNRRVHSKKILAIFASPTFFRSSSDMELPKALNQQSKTNQSPYSSHYRRKHCQLGKVTVEQKQKNLSVIWRSLLYSWLPSTLK